MSKATDIQTAKTTGDVVLQEMWRIKDTLSASYGHDVKRLLPKRASTRNFPATRWSILRSAEKGEEAAPRPNDPR